MDISEEMSDESPCLIVPDSQASENGGESSDVLKGLTMLQPTSNVLSKSLDKMGGSDSSDSILPNSSSSEAHSHDTSSLTSSKDDSSVEKQEATKEHALYVIRSKQADNITRQNMFRTSTPMIQSDLPPVQGVDHLTPVHVEDTSATPTSQMEESKAKETSSSDDFVSPSSDSVVPKSSAEEADKSEIAQDQTNMTSQASKDVALSNQERSQQDTHHERQEKTSTDTFQCLQLSGESKTKGSSVGDILPSPELLRPGSPINQIGEVVKEKTNAEEHKNCEQQESTEMTDINNDQRGSTLPLWQQNMTRPDRVSPVIATLTRTSSDVSTISSPEVSTQESSLRQWQSSGNDSDCDMFQTDHHESLPSNSLPKTGTQQGSSVPQHSHFKGLSLPELSEDIFQHKPKGITAEKPIQEKDSCHGDDRSTMGNILEPPTDKLEPSPADDVILSSQDDVFCLHLTQSQASTTASQARSQPDRLTSLLDIETRGTTDKEGNTVNNITSHSKEGKIVNTVTLPCTTSSNTILVQTPAGHPSTTGHHRDITGNQTNTGNGQATRESPEPTRESISEPSDLAGLTRENISHPSDLEARADSKMNESTESIESGVVGFHFSPPAMLLKPVPRTSPPCLDTNSETIQDRSQEFANATEFRPVSPDLMATSPDLVTTISEPTVPTLSLSVPVPSEENTDEQGFSLLKDVLDVDKIATLPTPSTRCIFTNVRERLQPARASSPDDEIDPFEFRDEVYTPPLSKRKRKSRYKERSGAKKRKSQDSSGINRSNDGQVWENYGTRCRESNLEQRQSSKERFWKIVKTNIITTTTTIIETQTEIIYTTQDGAVITMKSNTEFSEPTYKITTNENETREDVDVIPSEVTFSCSRNTEETPHGEASTSTNNRKSTASVQRHSNISRVKAPANSRATALKQSVQGNSMPTISKQARQSKECDIRHPKVAQPTNEKDVSETADSNVNERSKSKSAARLNKESDLRSSNVVQATKDNDILILDSSGSSVNELSKSASTPSTVSPPLFPASLNSTSSISSPDENTSSTEGKTETLPRKQTTDNATSLPKQKRKRPLSVDNQRTSRRSSMCPRIPHVLHEGTRVLALWYDKHYYPGHVVCKCNNDTKYHIEFDDGDQSDIQEECIVVAEYLPCDQPVMFCEKTGGEYIDGVIRGFYKDGDDRGYKVLGADKRVARCPRSNVMLSTEQAAIFLSLRDSMMIVQVSLESLDNNSTLNDNESRQNIIKTARRSHEKGTKKSQSDQKDAPTEPRGSCEQRTKKSRSGHEDAPTGPLTDRDTNTKGKAQGKRRGKDIVKIVPEKDSGVSAIKKRSRGGENNKKVLSESSSKKRGEENVNVLPDNNDSTKKVRETAVKHRNSSASETPKSSHKSTGKKSATNNLENGGSKDIDIHVSRVRRRLSTVMNDPLEKTRRIPTRKSPRKLNSRARNENLILPTNKDLFRGYGFILTGSDVTSVPDENSPQEEEQVFIRDDVIAQIKTGGGEVLNKFLEDYPARDSCFLLSNGCQTTAKYFYALVLGVPCLSHAWVRDCCAGNSLVSVKNYLLPAGKDLITEHLVEGQNYKDALRGLKVHLVGEDEFKQQWSEVLTAAGCEILQKLPTNILQKLQHGDNEFVCDVIVVGNGHVAHSTIQKARLLSIPTVTIHWVKQCILTGTRVDFNAHESFIYRVQGK